MGCAQPLVSSGQAHTSHLWYGLHPRCIIPASAALLNLSSCFSDDAREWELAVYPCEENTPSVLEQLQSITKEGEPFVWPVPSPGTSAAHQPEGKGKESQDAQPVTRREALLSPQLGRHRRDTWAVRAILSLSGEKGN